jgi:hypothetical protein
MAQYWYSCSPKKCALFFPLEINQTTFSRAKYLSIWPYMWLFSGSPYFSIIYLPAIRSFKAGKKILKLSKVWIDQKGTSQLFGWIWFIWYHMNMVEGLKKCALVLLNFRVFWQLFLLKLSCLGQKFLKIREGSRMRASALNVPNTNCLDFAWIWI